MHLDRLIKQNPQDPLAYVFGTPAQAKKPFISKLFSIKLILVSQFILSFGFFPLFAQASILSIFGLENTAVAQTSLTSAVLNSQTVTLPQATVALKGAAPDVIEMPIADDSALLVQSGPLGTQADIASSDIPESTDIYTYVVRSGDTLPVIAKMLDVSVGTIVWMNDLSGKNAKLVPGQVLAILPVSGLSYTIRKGDTVAGIAKKFKVDADEIGKFNGFELDSKLSAGETIIIPGAELALPTTITSSTKTNSQLPIVAYGATRLLPGNSGPDLGSYFIRPVNGCARTQGAHGKNGVDIACPKGIDTPILAAASGTVLIAKQDGWNGGFGEYVVINHPNGTQTLYGHMSRVDVVPGQTVSRGQVIGLMGATGRSTGKHLHFEVHGAVNPIALNARFGL